MSHVEREDLEGAIALLARALTGELEGLETGGLTWIPRPQAQGRAAEALAPSAKSEPPPPPAPAPAPAEPPAAEASTSAESPPAFVAPGAPTASALPVLAEGAGQVDAALLDVVQGPGSAQERLDRVLTEVLGDCRRCKLHRGRSKLVFGVGNPEADLVFVGEGPGGEEDRQGIPFVGKAGQLLTKMIEAMQLSRDDVYICNVVKCRPPNNRDPERDEVEACERFLKAQLAVVKPKVIVALGKYAAQTLLQSDAPISRLRGRWSTYEDVPVLPTFHPAYLLREPTKKREAWMDLQQVMKRLGLQGPKAD